MKTASELQAYVLDRAVSDREFRSRLLADPKAVIAEELGVRIPESYTIRVPEESSSAVHLVLPPEARLNSEELSLVSGSVLSRRDSGSPGNTPVSW